MPAAKKSTFTAERKMVCGNCRFCIKDDGSPYCVMKDLYTSVEPDDECDEQDFYGEYYFTEEKQDAELL